MKSPDETEIIDKNKALDAEAWAMLAILALGMKQVAEGKFSPAQEVVARLRAKYDAMD